MNVKIRTAEKSIEMGRKNRSKKCFVKKILYFGQSLWKTTLKEVFFTKPDNLKIVISLETSSTLVFFKYPHQIFLNRQCNLFYWTTNMTRTPQPDCININNTYFQINFKAAFLRSSLWSSYPLLILASHCSVIQGHLLLRGSPWNGISLEVLERLVNP